MDDAPSLLTTAQEHRRFRDYKNASLLCADYLRELLDKLPQDKLAALLAEANADLTLEMAISQVVEAKQTVKLYETKFKQFMGASDE